MKWLCFPGWAVEFGHLRAMAPEAEEINYHFYSEGSFPEIENFIPSVPYSILCYSMGTLHALKAAQISRPEKIVSIAGFAHFPGKGDDAKRRKLLIMQMIRGLKSNPVKTVKDFSLKAGLEPPSCDEFNTNNLIKGLELLKDCDMSQALNNNLNLTLISSDNDTIVPGHISKQLLSGEGCREHITIQGSHGAWQSKMEKIREITER